jgi:serine/threonine protein kinase
MLGKGSFGEVYLAEKKSTKKMYAIKVLEKDRIFNQNLVRYAKTERNVLSIMNHPFIVKLNFAFQTDKKLFLVMDFCSG